MGKAIVLRETFGATWILTKKPMLESNTTSRSRKDWVELRRHDQKAMVIVGAEWVNVKR